MSGLAVRGVLSLLLLCVGAAGLVAQNTREAIAADFEKRRDKVLAEAGQRHLRLGSWAREAGLVPQATAQFLRAVEVSRGKNPGAQTVLAYMRGLGDAFWNVRRKRIPKATLAEFDKRAAANEAKTRKDHLDLATRAIASKLVEQAKEHYRSVLELGGELQCDDKGVWRIEGKRIDEELGQWLSDQSATDKQGRKVFEAAGAAAPRLEGLTVHEDELLQVRTDLPGDAAARLHALGSALLPHLRERLEGAPTRRLVLTVFAKRDDYVAYLTARGMANHAVASGLADGGTFQTLVSAQRVSGEMLGDPELQALVLHELSHLYFFGVAPAGMPEWYSEGFAESFGAQGTFTWDGTTLTVGGKLPAERLVADRPNMLPLRLLFDARALILLGTDRAKANAYYTQCWALHRFLREDDCPWRDRFAFFEAKCRGQVLGAPQEGRSVPDPAPAGAQFLQLFGEDLDRLEAA
ncbi:MAG: hypothetical protein KDC48_12175, partial [Planctomycetes bacterium]|nr:hypothetical protein [Planctomycetota bacterium]